jgi:hypothetical protein
MAGLGVLIATAEGLATVVPSYRFTPEEVIRGPAADVLDQRLARE